MSIDFGSCHTGAVAGFAIEGHVPAREIRRLLRERPDDSVDQAAGRVNITHGPVASANWPGMTMSFKLADVAAAGDLKPGQHVEFRFTIESGMDATVTQIKAVD